MSFGTGFGALATGLAGGMQIGQGINDARSARAAKAQPKTPSTAIGDTAAVGFGLGNKLASGDVASAGVAQPAVEADGGSSWGALGSILSSLAPGGDTGIAKAGVQTGDSTLAGLGLLNKFIK